MQESEIEKYVEKLKNLSEHGQKEVCIFIDFWEQYEKEKKGEKL